MTDISPKLLSVIIVSYNTREMTLQCLETLYKDLALVGVENCEVIVVDNASKDGSIEAVRSAYPDVVAVPNPRNAGFGAANNLAMGMARGKYFLLLNSDAFPLQGAIAAMLNCIERYPKAAMVGPRLLNADGSLQISCYRFPSPVRAWVENLWISSVLPSGSALGDYRKWAHDVECTVDSVIGACMLVRREAFEEVGGFDERYFMYQEETDWQKTFKERGWTVVFTPTSQVTHLGGASGKAESAKISETFFESLDIYQRKHHGLFGMVQVRLAMIVGCGARMVLWSLVSLLPSRRKSAQAKARLHGKLFLRQATQWRSSPRLAG